MKELTLEYLKEAEAFERLMRDDEMFTHFKHTHVGDMIESPYWDVFVKVENDEIVAWEQIQYFADPTKVHVARLGYAVHPSYRNMNYGQHMLEHSIEHCMKNDAITKLTASSRLDNIPMVVLFIRNGFHIEGCYQHEIGDKHIVSWARFI